MQVWPNEKCVFESVCIGRFNVDMRHMTMTVSRSNLDNHDEAGVGKATVNAGGYIAPWEGYFAPTSIFRFCNSFPRLCPNLLTLSLLG